jgi:hypothetical protein
VNAAAASSLSAAVITVAFVGGVVLLAVAASRSLRQRAATKIAGPRGVATVAVLVLGVVWFLLTASRRTSSGSVALDFANDIVPMIAGAVVWVGLYAWARRYRPSDVTRLKELGRGFARGDVDQKELGRGYRPYLSAGALIWLGLMMVFYAGEARFRM